MYSIVLFIVETSLSGLSGSGAQPDVRGGQDLRHELVRDAPGQVDGLGESELVAPTDEVVVAVAGPHERERDVVAPHVVHHDVGCAEGDVDAVLRAHDPEVGHEVRGGRGAGRATGSRRRSRSGSGPVRTTRDVLDGLAPTVGGDRGIRLVRRGDPVRGPEGLALEEEQTLVRARPWLPSNRER